MKNDILEFALLLARAAEAEIMPRFRSCAVHWKPDGTEVTDADRRAEEVMRELIATHSPSDAILGEEFGGAKGATSGPLWVLDPIDGTASFALGLPTFGTLIGYIENGEPQVGVIHLPAMGEMVYAAKGFGCWAKIADRSPEQVHVSGVTDLSKAYVSTTCPSSSRSWATERIQKLSTSARKFRVISDCVQHALVSQGRIDAALEPIMSPWDIAALVPCIEEAGGTITDLEGRRTGIVWQRNLLSSSSPQLHQEMLALLQVTA
jgi:histidinol-phosphatase